MKEFLKKNSNLIAFLLGCILLIVIGLVKNIDSTEYLFDSMDYYLAGKGFIVNGNFALTNYTNTFRGYLFPLIICMYIKVGNFFNLPDYISILIGTSIFVSLLINIILPKLFFDNYKKNNIFMRIIPNILIVLYWQDLIYYPLSDLYSIFFVVIAIKLMLDIKKQGIKTKCLHSVLIGILIYGCYNIRTIYLFVVPLLIIIFIIFNGVIKKEKTIYIELVLIIVGAMTCAFPQFIINRQLHNQNSIAVITSQFNGGSLFNDQLYMGLFTQRYDTYVGDLNEYPTVQLSFIDSNGLQIVANENIKQIESIGEYVKIVMKYPMDYVGIIGRHVINVLYLPYGHVYVNDLNHHKSLYALINYIMLFVAGLYTLKIEKKNWLKISEKRLYIYSMIVPCILILPGAIEMRFFVLMYIVLYEFIAYDIDYIKLYEYSKKNKVKIFVAMILIFILLCSLWGNTMSSAQWLPQLLK